MEHLLKAPIILLAGPKHTGKTSTGRLLARILGGTFVDLDERVEEQTGRSPRSLYQEGPGRFRAAEARALESLLGEWRRERQGRPEAAEAGTPLVAAAGGGLIDNEEALRILGEAPEIQMVYLELSPETAWERILKTSAEGGGLPPFLRTPHPEQTHRELHIRRGSAYKELADMSIGAEDKTPEALSEELFRIYRGACETHRVLQEALS